MQLPHLGLDSSRRAHGVDAGKFSDGLEEKLSQIQASSNLKLVLDHKEVDEACRVWYVNEL